MRLLLDTHCWLWWLAEPERLSPDALGHLGDGRNEIYLSVASAWEIAIKVGLGKLRLPLPPEEYIPARLASQNMHALAIELDHVTEAGRLALHHRDPFDRLLVAQARREALTLVSADVKLRAYEVEFLWAAR